MKIFRSYGNYHSKERQRLEFWFSKLDPAIKRMIIMRINFIAFFVLLTISNLFATVSAQDITITVKNAPIKAVFNEIKKQSGYQFFYNNSDIIGAKPVTANLKKANIKVVLDYCLKEQPFSYEIVDQTIVIKRKSSGVIDKITSFLKNLRITGKVLDEDGQALSGATVSVKGTDQLTVTNQQGNFNLENVTEGTLLLVSFMGYETLEVKAKDNIVIKLVKSISKLDEVQVIAYGTTTQRLSTGSVSTVRASDIEKQPVSNPLATLQGRVPGLVITQRNGLPGSNFSVQIRGQNSMQQGSEPFYIVDGVPYISENLAQNSLLFANSPLNNLSPSDIESIEILKDADATAIYGSRGANGVILITTKKAKAGNTTIDASFYSGFGKVTRSLDFMNTQQYIEMRYEAFKNDNVTPTTENAYDLLAWDNTRYTDWKRELTGETAKSTNAQIRLSGGSDLTKISFNTTYYKETTVFPGSFADKRITADLNASHRSKDNKFNFIIRAGYGSETSNLMRQNLASSTSLIPNTPSVYDNTGKLNFSENGFSFTNPIARLMEKYGGVTDRLTTNTNISYKILPQLTLKTNMGYNFMQYDERALIPIASQDPTLDPTGTSVIANNRIKLLIVEPQLEYEINFGNKNKIQLLTGATWQTSKNTRTRTSGSGFTNDDFLNFISVSTAPTITTSNGFNQYNYQAVFARVNFSHNDKYIVNLTGRRDGSSRFGPDRQFANFGALGAAWIFTKEDFIAKQLQFLSFGKIRGSYGITGNDQIGDYQYLDSWKATSRSYMDQLSLEPTRLSNSAYGWEENKKFDAAIDLGFWKDRILFSANWYRNRSDNQLIFYTLPTQTGFYNILKNFPGKVQNAGWEFQANSTNVKSKSFTWSTSLNVTIARNKLLEFPGLEISSFSNNYVIGEPLNILRGYRYTGIDRETGIYGFEDKNGDNSYNSQDYYTIGSINPNYFGGFQNNFHYKGFELDFLFQFVKQKGRHPIYGNSLAAGFLNNSPKAYLDRWQSPGDSSPYQKFTQQAGSPAYNAAFLMSSSDKVLTDASYIRLKNISLSYSFPLLLTQKLKLRTIRVFAQAQNLFTITNFMGDPETQNFQSLPPLKMITTGVQVQF